MNDVEERAETDLPRAVLSPVHAARSNRNPSTCISVTQYRKLSINNWSARGCRMFNVLPHPV